MIQWISWCWRDWHFVLTSLRVWISGQVGYAEALVPGEEVVIANAACTTHAQGVSVQVGWLICAIGTKGGFRVSLFCQGVSWGLRGYNRWPLVCLSALCV